MGDVVLKQDPKYLPNKILPKLPYPNQFYGYTRYRLKNRPVDEAYWDQMLLQINEEWNEKKRGKLRQGKM